MSAQLSVHGVLKDKRKLEDSTVVITGAGSGIGRFCYELFYEAGANVIGCDLEGADIVFDVRCLNDWAKLMVRCDSVDVLLNIAGIMPIGSFLSMSPEVIKNQVDINLLGVMYGMKAVLPGMVERGYGHVVNIASILGTIPIAGGAVYSATKYGVIGLSESMRIELRNTGVRVSHILPSLVNTRMTAGVKLPLWPRPTTPEKVAKAILKGVRRGQVGDIWVPGIMKWPIELGKLFPRSWREYLAGEAFGLYGMFMDADQQKRRDYEHRVVRK